MIVKKGQQFGRAEPVHVLEEVFEQAITPIEVPEGAEAVTYG